MSLRPDDRSSRSRSKSATRDRDRSRSRSNVRAPEPHSPPKAAPYGYAAPPPMPPPPGPPGSYGNAVTSPTYEVRSPTSAGAERSGYFGQAPAASAPYPTPPTMPYPQEEDGFTMGDYKDFPPHERPGYVPPAAQFPQYPQDDGLAYGDVSSPHASRQQSYSSHYPQQSPHSPYPPQHSQNPYSTQHPQSPYSPQQAENPMSPYRHNAEPVTNTSRSSSYSYQYAQPPQEIKYTAQPQTGAHNAQYTQTSHGQYHEQLPRTYGSNSYDRDADIVEVAPRHEKSDRKSSKSKNVRLAVDTKPSAALEAPRSPGMAGRMDRLSVSGNRPDLSGYGGSGGLPPPSPLLEAYHGTYQQISPMPLAIRGLDDDDDELDMLPPLSPQVSRSGNKHDDKLSREAAQGKEKKRVKLYDPEQDAKTISHALGRSKIDTEAICEILATRSHDEIMYLRKEYKKQVKVQGKGVNLSKHLKTKLTGNFGKAAYVTALGRWESEGYWANFWYQSHTSRRELLIESLMGRTNGEIWNIKDEFKDKRYSDSLVKCMEKELKMDKFRTAVLMVLEERRQEEQDVYPVEYRNRDVDTLHKALMAPKGGESTMLEIIVRRSDAHLREVLKTYERMYQENFPRAALKKSNNLVGEVIAHILNGVINKPARDALLVRHAIKDIAEKNKDDELRYELLISRLVRLHWDKLHLTKVKKEYYDRYKKHLEDDIEESTRGDFAEFMVELCQTK